MKRASVRDLRYNFAEVERLLQEGENIEITKRRPDFLARLKRIYGTRILNVSNAELLARERDRS